MKMVTAHVGSSVLVRLTGRLDGEWSRHLADTLDELLRDGMRSVILDMSQVDYISTPAVQVLGQRYRDFSLIRGELRVASPSAAVLQALTDAALLDQLLLLPGDERVAGGAGRPSALLARPASEFTGDAWHVPAATGPAGQYEISRRHLAGELACRVVGQPAGLTAGLREEDCRTISFTSSTFGLGIGAIGETFDETSPRFGELIGVAGTVAYLPTDGALVPDYLSATAHSAPSAVLGSGLVLDGTFTNLIRFRTQPGAASVPLAELAGVALATSTEQMAGLVVAAEATELVTTALRHSPAVIDAPATLDAAAMREWLAFSPERTLAQRAVVIAGVVARQPPPGLADFLRPLNPSRDLVGHFHAMVFPYRPVPQRAVALRAIMEKLVESQLLRSVGHLVFDDRDADSVGENALLRGLCWTARVTSVTAA
jgi:anti-anti-sigma factor